MTKTSKPAAAPKPSRTRKPKGAVPAATSTPSAVEAPPTQAPAQPALTGKLAVLVDLLRRPEGARLADLTAATGWQAHSVRGAMSGALKKKRGMVVISTKDEAGRVYRVQADA